jgi:hypothetical protein
LYRMLPTDCDGRGLTSNIADNSKADCPNK